MQVKLDPEEYRITAAWRFELNYDQNRATLNDPKDVKSFKVSNIFKAGDVELPVLDIDFKATTLAAAGLEVEEDPKAKKAKAKGKAKAGPKAIAAPPASAKACPKALPALPAGAASSDLPALADGKGSPKNEDKKDGEDEDKDEEKDEGGSGHDEDEQQKKLQEEQKAAEALKAAAASQAALKGKEEGEFETPQPKRPRIDVSQLGGFVPPPPASLCGAVAKPPVK